MFDTIKGSYYLSDKDDVHRVLTHLDADALGRKLSEIIEFARTYAGVDARKAPIPVQPTCHYMMGGIATATDADGQVRGAEGGGISLEGLFAAGECACVSVHGANRLGCNSLLDTLVFGRRAGKAIDRFIRSADPVAAAPQQIAAAQKKFEQLFTREGGERIGPVLSAMQETMMDHCSVSRQK